MENVKKTPLFDTHEKNGAKMVDFAGWGMPIEYEGIIPEHHAVRKDVGIFDVSHMGEILLEGKDAKRYLDYIVSNDISIMEDGKVVYTHFTNENGGVVDDLLVYKYSDEKILLVVNASNVDKDYAWVSSHKEGFEVSVKNLSDETAEIAIQGPKAEKVLQRLTDFNLSEMGAFTFRDHVTVDGIDCLISRTGYTGEDGFEIYMKPDQIEKLWNKFLEIGKEDGLKPIGLGARDTLRFEARLPLYGNEFDDNISPLEAGYGMFVKVDKASDFIGKSALKAQKEKGLQRKVMGLEILGKGIARHGYDVYKDDKKVGVITTGYASPTLGKTIALALIDLPYAKLDEELKVQVRNRFLDAKVIKSNFYSKNYKK
ncbi:MAG: glycine cleavage system aminomethyltransferase GcvT [Peptostreptococcaceae bacterium]|nr:glycine cleavage system aminomethyltransferase GcvT [Peptostreptococcaceae bacterium]